MNWSDELPIARRRRLYVDVAEAILDGIRAGRWAAGSRLPSDRELSEQLHVSRPTVREALLVLEFAGMIEIRHGSGAYVIGNAAAAPGTGIGGESPRHLIEARIQLEPVIARLCATRLTEAQIEHMTTLIRLSERAVDASDNPVELIRLGLQFHRALADGCGNEYLAGFCRTLVSVTDHPLWNLLHRQVLTTEESRRHELLEHRHIIDAIRRRDPEAAGKAMASHLESLWGIVLDEGTRGASEQRPAASSQASRR
jgi:DNA-binding FadR family transcriptional regulator